MAAPGIDGEKCGMVPGRWSPCSGRVAGLAIRRECCRSVIGIGGIIVILLMTSYTRRGSSGVNAIDVARGTCRCHMCAGQREACIAMTECGWLPRHCCMAYRAVQ